FVFVFVFVFFFVLVLVVRALLVVDVLFVVVEFFFGFVLLRVLLRHAGGFRNRMRGSQPPGAVGERSEGQSGCGRKPLKLLNALLFFALTRVAVGARQASEQALASTHARAITGSGRSAAYAFTAVTPLPRS